MKRLLKNVAKRSWYKAFRLGQKCRVDIMPRHFYSEVPDLGKLSRTMSWRLPYDMSSLSMPDSHEQLDLVVKYLSGRCDNARAGAVYGHACRDNGEPGFGPIEAQVLYGYICNNQPARIIQVGCGVSTAIMLRAAADSGYVPEVICIEPYPGGFLVECAQAGKIRLIAKPVEDVSFDLYEELAAGDLFFVDSSHTLGPAGEVTRLIIDILPKLPVGVVAHFHDIWFPYDYPGRIFKDNLTFCHESTLLMGFLAFNSSFKILACLSWLHYNCQDQLKKLMPDYKPRVSEYAIIQQEGHFPSSIYIERIK